MNDEIIISKMLELAKMINYDHNDIEFLKQAMHCQRIYKNNDGKNRKNYTNDSLATFGDSIIKFVISEYLFDKKADKGKITVIKQHLEDNETLYNICNETGINQYAYNGVFFAPDAPLEQQVFHSKHDVYIEAIIAAIYKDKGFEYVKEWTLDFFKKNSRLLDLADEI